MTPAQCRAARALLGLEQADLAAAAGIARATVVDFERGARVPRKGTIDALRIGLEDAGIDFIDENGGGVGVRLRNKD